MKKILVVVVMMLIVLVYSQTPKYVPSEGFNDVFREPTYGIYESKNSEYACYVGGEIIARIEYETDGNGGDVFTKITVYADTIIVANPNTVIIWEEI